MVPNFSYIRPTTLAQAIGQAAAPGAKVLAGGTDLLGCLRDGVHDAKTVVSLSRLAELRGISEASAGLRIGALTTVAQVAAHPLVNQRYAALAKAAASVASPQLRNQGTIGGNLCQRPRCWYFRGDFPCTRKGGDTCYAMGGENQYHCIIGGAACLMVHPSDIAPALVALGARVTIAGPRGARTIPLDSFFVLPEQDVSRENVLEAGEIVTEVLLPPTPPQFVSTYRKIRARGAWDFALASLAAALAFKEGRVESARLVLGAAAPAPWRAVDAEKAIAGKRLDSRTIERAAFEAVKDAAPLQQNEYKLTMFRGLMTEVLETLATSAGRTT
jgi:xanthine dehydrogenase YagS FAD-binding subunit